ncbi:hypothetical protein pb186bvf_013624 [Paramecium bursaria]
MSLITLFISEENEKKGKQKKMRKQENKKIRKFYFQQIPILGIHQSIFYHFLKKRFFTSLISHFDHPEQMIDQYYKLKYNCIFNLTQQMNSFRQCFKIRILRKISDKKVFALPNTHDNGDCNIADWVNSQAKYNYDNLVYSIGTLNKCFCCSITTQTQNKMILPFIWTYCYTNRFYCLNKLSQQLTQDLIIQNPLQFLYISLPLEFIYRFLVDFRQHLFAYLISGSYFIIDQYQQEKVQRKLFLKSYQQFELLIDEFIDDQVIILEKDEENVTFQNKILNNKLPEICNDFNLFLKNVSIPQYKSKLQNYLYKSNN